ncbi:PspC domain-containing protein [Corynebacterium glutamicum]|uniref:PspC domain-containing protein n=1 Tax=Corynebacterium glutamicum TaxID=1718 RepID=UPI001B8D2EA5|nr:PspC domain-containing protein [Corynebacterium glutamicum]
MTFPAQSRRLARSTTDKWIGGVAGGLAETYGWNPAYVRLAFVASILFPLPGSQILFYALAWLIIPSRENRF